MPTIKQLVYRKTRRFSKFHRCTTPALKQCPQKKGIVIKTLIEKPKKPNSAKRKIAKLRLSTLRIIRATIPGKPSFSQVKSYSRVLIRGGRTRDLIGLRYRIILGVFDAQPFTIRRTSLSKYGVSKSQYMKQTQILLKENF